MLRSFAASLLLIAASLPISCNSQTVQNSVSYQNYAPSGPCSLPTLLTVNNGGGVYQCYGMPNTWHPVGGSGTFNALSGDATSGPNGGATTVTGLNGVILSTLTNGMFKFTAGVPSAAVPGTDYVLPNVDTLGSLNRAAGGPLLSGAYTAAYTLPTATTSILGGVRPDGTTITISGGVISSTGGGANYPTGSGIPVVVSGASWGTTLAAPTSTIVGTADTQTLTNKTVDGVTPTVFGFIDPTSSVQTQLNTKLTAVSVTTANGISGTSSGGATPALTLALGAITPTSVSATGPVSGTTVTGGVPSSAAQAALPTGSHGFACDETSTAGVPAAGVDYIRCSSAHALVQSINGGSEVTIGSSGVSTISGDGALISNVASSGTVTLTLSTAAAHVFFGNNTGSTTTPSYVAISTADLPAATTQTIASGTSTLGTSAIVSGACAAVVTTTATGVATTDVVPWGFNSDPTGITGYIPSTNGMLTIIAYPSVNNVNFKVCNNTASSVTPGAVTLNWRILR